MHTKCGTLSTVLKNKLLNFFCHRKARACHDQVFNTRPTPLCMAKRREKLVENHNVGRAHHREMRMRFILSTLNETWLASNIVRGN